MKAILSAVWHLFLSLDGIIYNLICYIFDIFYYLCGLQFFTDADYNKIVSKIYIVLGLIMMFVLAYSLLKAVINPDEFAKGENSFPKLIKNVIVSLVIIVILPTVFNVAFSIQNSLLNYDVIPQLILGTDDGAVDGVPNINGAPGGRAIAFYTFKSFLVPNTTDDICNGTDEEGCRNNIKGNEGWGKNDDALAVTDEAVFSSDSSFSQYTNYSEAVRDDQLTYYFPISTVAGIFILYVLLNFCFDMALRVVKLAFYQIIAPIPVICRVIPGGKLKDVFSKWVKQVISLFVEVFIRIAALTFGVYLIGLIVEKFDNKLPGIDSLNLVGQKTIVLALLIMSVIIFVKQIPKIIGDMFGLDTGGMKLGLMDKLAQGGALTAGAIAGGALGTLGRNTVSAVKGVGKAQGGWNKFKAGVAGAASVGAGALSGGFRGFKGGKGAKNLADMKKAAGTAVADATTAKGKRDAYRAAHSGKNAVHTMLNVGAGHIFDKADSVGAYFGIGDELQNLQAEQAVYQEGMGFKKKLFDLVSDNERVLAYQGLKKTAQEKDINNYISDIEKQISARGFSNKDNTGYFKVNNITGQKEYYKDANGHILNDLTSTAIEQKTADIKMYDDAVKLASLNAIYDKVNKGDGRFTAVFNESKVWKEQHADMPDVSKLFDLGNLDAKQISAINSALTSNNAADIKQVLDALEGDATAMSALNIGSSGIMSNDKNLKVSNGNVTDKIAKKVQEKKKDGK